MYSTCTRPRSGLGLNELLGLTENCLTKVLQVPFAESRLKAVYGFQRPSDVKRLPIKRRERLIVESVGKPGCITGWTPLVRIKMP